MWGCWRQLKTFRFVRRVRLLHLDFLHRLRFIIIGVKSKGCQITQSSDLSELESQLYTTPTIHSSNSRNCNLFITCRNKYSQYLKDTKYSMPFFITVLLAISMWSLHLFTRPSDPVNQWRTIYTDSFSLVYTERFVEKI